MRFDEYSVTTERLAPLRVLSNGVHWTIILHFNLSTDKSMLLKGIQRCHEQGKATARGGSWDGQRPRRRFHQESCTMALGNKKDPGLIRSPAPHGRSIGQNIPKEAQMPEMGGSRGTCSSTKAEIVEMLALRFTEARDTTKTLPQTGLILILGRSYNTGTYRSCGN